MLSSNIENPDFNTISKLFSDEFEKIKKNIYCYYKKNINEKIKQNYKIISKEIELNIPHKIELNNLNFTFAPLSDQEIIGNQKSNENLPKNYVKNLTISQINNIINMNNLPEIFGSANINANKEEKNAAKMPEDDYSIYFQNSQTPNIFQGSKIISQHYSESERAFPYYEENNYNQNNIPIEYNYNYDYNFDNQQLNIKVNDNTSGNITEIQNYTLSNNCIIVCQIAIILLKLLKYLKKILLIIKTMV